MIKQVAKGALTVVGAAAVMVLWTVGSTLWLEKINITIIKNKEPKVEQNEKKVI